MPKVGLVLLGGGFAGCYQVGLPKVLWEKNWIPSKIQGVSVGALNAAKLVESNPDELKKIWIDIEEKGPNVLFPSLGLVDIAKAAFAKRDHVYAGQSLDNLLDRNLDPEKVLASPIELEVVVWNTKKRRAEIFANKGESIVDDQNDKKKTIRHVAKDPQILRKAIRASASLPGFFPPVEINGELYSDGYWMKLESFADSDVVFLLDNDQVTISADPQDGWRRNIVRQLFAGFRDTLDELIDTKIDLFLERYPNFNAKVDSPIDLFKKLWRDLTGNSARLVILTPFYQISSLRLDYFKYGDITNAVGQSIIQAQKVWDQMQS